MIKLIKLISEIKIMGGGFKPPNIGEIPDSINSYEEFKNYLKEKTTILFNGFIRLKEKLEAYSHEDKRKYEENYWSEIRNIQNKVGPSIKKKWKQIFNNIPDIPNFKKIKNFLYNYKLINVNTYNWNEGNNLLGPKSTKNIQKILENLSISTDDIIIYKGKRVSKILGGSNFYFFQINEEYFTALYTEYENKPLIFVNTLRGSGPYWMLYTPSGYNPGNNTMIKFLKFSPEELKNII